MRDPTIWSRRQRITDALLLILKSTALRVRRWRESDLEAIVACQRAAWPEYSDEEQYGVRRFQLAYKAFREGQVLAEIDGEVVGYATSVILQLAAPLSQYSFDELTGSGTFSTHTPAGDTLYGADIAVHPDHRGKRIASKLYDARKRLLRKHNLRRMVAFGRLPGYHAVETRMKAETYVAAVVEGKRKDPALTAHLRNGYRVLSIRNDLMDDPASGGWATLLEYENPIFDVRKRRSRPRKSKRRTWPRARVCMVQWRIQDGVDAQKFSETASYFATVANEYGCHVAVFPEFVCAPLLGGQSGVEPGGEMRELAKFHDEYVEIFKNLAMERQLYIVAGSHPVVRDGKLFNVAHLMTPSGNVYTQDKLHLTPYEREVWKFTEGEELRIFDGPFGKFLIQVCFDIEFPEPTRICAELGIDTVFVPFSTDDEAAYLRVRLSAQARCIENHIYVGLSGSCGNLSHASYLLNYSQSAVVTPSDFGFPPRAVAAEAPPHEQTVAIADLDYALLDHARQSGSVRPSEEIRHDIYELRSKTKVRKILLDGER